MMDEKKVTISASDVDQLHVDAVVEMIRSRRITDDQVKQINTELLRRAGDQFKNALQGAGEAWRALGEAFGSGDSPPR